MKTQLAIFTTLLLLCANGAIADQTLTQSYTIENIQEIIVGGGAELEIRQGNKETLRAEATADALKNISVDLSGQRLTLTTKQNNRNFWDWFTTDTQKIKFIVEIKQLSQLELTGATTASLGKLNGDQLTIRLHGASQFNSKGLHLNTLRVDASGASKIKLAAVQAQEFAANVSGASQLHIQRKGNVDSLQLEANGASHFSAKDLKIQHARVNASGASHIEIRAIETLEAEASGASHINYYGHPRVKNNSSGASHINSLDNN
jgi:hypothetical protein